MLTKVDAMGEITWKQIFNSSFDGYPESVTAMMRSVEQAEDGGYILFGNAFDSRPALGPHIIRTDSEGNEIWNYFYRENDFYVGGREIRGQTTLDGGYILGGGRDIQAVKLNADRTLDWSKPYSSLFPEQYFHSNTDIIQTLDEGYILLGTAWNPMITYLIKLDSEGEVIWNKTWDGVTSLEGDIIETLDGGYLFGNGFGEMVKTDSEGNEIWKEDICGGASESIRQTSEGEYVMVCNNNNIVKVNSEGNEIIWTRTIEIPEGFSHIDFEEIRQTSNGGFILGGRVWNSTENYLYSLLVSLSANGSLLWDKTYNNYPYGELTFSVKQTVDEGYVFAGYASAPPSVASGGCELNCDADLNGVCDYNCDLNNDGACDFNCYNPGDNDCDYFCDVDCDGDCDETGGDYNCTSGNYCGDGDAGGDEDCDGGDLNDETCGSQGYGSGNLSCTTDCGFDFGNCVQPPVCGDGECNGAETCETCEVDCGNCEEETNYSLYGQQDLPFFGLLQGLAVIVLIIIIYFVLNRKKIKGKTSRKSKRNKKN
jgi:hypothetical protein